jgi:(p)ppGpp synthase/HD superfamily hydrolase
MKWTQDSYKRALDFAARWHFAQSVPGSHFPYVTHLAKVAMETMAACDADSNLDGELAVTCALLHDTIEDTPVTKEQLEEQFGARVASGVQALTKEARLPKDSQMADCLRRIREQPKEIWVVKLADRITNLEPPPKKWPIEKVRKYLEEAREILAQLKGASALLEARFQEKLAAYERYSR